MKNLRWTEKVGDVWYGMLDSQIRAIFYFAEDAEEWCADYPLKTIVIYESFDAEKEQAK